MNKIYWQLVMWGFVATISFMSIQMANDIGGIWINISWGIAVWFGIQTVLMYELIKEYKKEKKT